MLCAQLLLAAVSLLSAPVAAQGPNTVAVYNPNLRTAGVNYTYFLVPIETSYVAAAAKPYSLLPVPTSDASLFPHGFPAGYHPVLVNAGYMSDIRMADLEIPDLLSAAIYIPFVDRLDNGRTPFNYPTLNFIGGVDGQDINALVPTVVGSAEGTTIVEATFDPNTEAWLPLGSGVSSQDVKELIVPNPVSGPGVELPAIDTQFTMNPKTPLYTSHTFHSIINQPTILTNSTASNGTLTPEGSCQRNTYYYNSTEADPAFLRGNVTLYSTPTGADAANFGGVYTNVGGYTAFGNIIGYNPQDCASAAADVDPKASA